MFLLTVLPRARPDVSRPRKVQRNHDGQRKVFHLRTRQSNARGRVPRALPAAAHGKQPDRDNTGERRSLRVVGAHTRGTSVARDRRLHAWLFPRGTINGEGHFRYAKNGNFTA